MSKKLSLIAMLTLAAIISTLSNVEASTWINLNGSSELKVSDSQKLDGFTEATWNIWVKEGKYTNNAGLFGKYEPRTGKRSYIIRTSLLNGTSVIISADGTNSGVYSSSTIRACGIRKAQEWTMITVTYDGSRIKYYRNGVLCDQDTTTISSIHDSPSPLRIGGGNNLHFSGGIDDAAIYNRALSTQQIMRMYNESVYGSNLGQSIPVLVYHRIEDMDSTIAVSPDKFAQQMAYLNENGFNTITLAQYNDWKKGTFVMPPKAVILVFDDGWKSVLTEAKPVMDDYGFVGSLATVTRYADFTNSPSYMKWSEIQQLQNAGWSIESHGISHSHMLSLSEQQFRDQLEDSKQKITDKLGKTPKSFIFPFHESNVTYTKICGEYYDLCWTQGSPNPSYVYKSTQGKEHHSLRRINVIPQMSMEDYADLFRKDTDKAAEWKMNEGFGLRTQDTSGNNNWAYLVNGSSWQASNSMGSFKLAAISIPRSYDPHNISLDSDKLGKIIDTDIGKRVTPIIEEPKWPDDMVIEHDHHYDGEKEKSNKTIKTKDKVDKILKKTASQTEKLSAVKKVKSTLKETKSSLPSISLTVVP